MWPTRFLFRRMHHVPLALLLAGAIYLLTGCARPTPGLWPPAPGERRYPVTISTTASHSVLEIQLPLEPDEVLDPQQRTAALAVADPPLEGWTFAERAWFVEKRQGLAGAARAMFWPTAGVLARDRDPLPYRERFETHASWQLEIGERGLRQMQALVQGELAQPLPFRRDGACNYYATRSTYHLFHTCNHFTARMLWAAGVPVRASRCWTPWGLWKQLDALTPRLPGTLGPPSACSGYESTRPD